MKNIAILGAGFIAQAHSDAYLNIDGCKVVGVADIKTDLANAIAVKHGAKAYSDAEMLIADKSVDIVDICLPTFLHEKFAVLAAEHGKHIILEKPFALTVKEADHINQVVTKTGVKFMVAQVLRFWPEYLVIKKIIDSGEIGEVRMVRAERMSQPTTWANWFRKPELSGGALIDLMIHDLDFTTWILGKPIEAFGRGQQSEYGAWDHIMATISYAGGKEAQIEATTLMPERYPFTMSFRAIGTKGTLEFTFKALGNVENRDSARKELLLFKSGLQPECVPLPSGDGYYNELKYYVDCINKDIEPNMITKEEARNILALALTIGESMESRDMKRFRI